jgi:hypothetical protein
MKSTGRKFARALHPGLKYDSNGTGGENGMITKARFDGMAASGLNYSLIFVFRSML